MASIYKKQVCLITEYGHTKDRNFAVLSLRAGKKGKGRWINSWTCSFNSLAITATEEMIVSYCKTNRLTLNQEAK